MTLLRLPFEYADVILLLFATIFVVHFVRRAFRQPKPMGEASAVEVPGARVKAYDIVQRLYHWSLFMVLGLVAITGINIYYTGFFNFFLAPFGIGDALTSIYWHTTLLWLFLAIIVIHIVWDMVPARGWGNIMVHRKDISDTFTRMKNFFGVTKEYPKHGKYDIFMKTLHWGVTLCIVVLGITGIYLWNPYGLFPAISPDYSAFLTLLHDIFSFLFIGLIIGHIYFAVLPVNWPVLRSIVTGSVSKEEYLKEFDTGMWPLVRGKAAPKAMVVLPKELERP